MRLQVLKLIVILHCLISYFAFSENMCGEPFVTISDIQGAGSQSLYNGALVTTEGVVTLSRTGKDGLKGYFIQSLKEDGNPATSEGLFVYDPQKGGITPGQILRLTAKVKEYKGMTELVKPENIQFCGKAELNSRNLSSEETIRWESLEGMLVTFSDKAEIINTHKLFSSGQLLLGYGSNQILLDDSSYKKHSSQTLFVDQLGHFRLGDKLVNISGVVDQFTDYQIQITRTPGLEKINLRPSEPDRKLSDLRVVSFNVQNLFNGEKEVNNNSKIISFVNSRGAKSLKEMSLQRAKLARSIRLMAADLYNLQELENDFYEDFQNSALASLIQEIVRQNKKEKENTSNLKAITVPVDQVHRWSKQTKIAQAFLYDPDVLEPLGNLKWLEARRSPLAQLFMHKLSGQKFWAVNVHLKSKGGCRYARGKDKDDGRGCYNGRRIQQVSELIRWIERLQKLEPYSVILSGDFNAGTFEKPVTLLANGFVQTVKNSYSTEYKGNKELLDFIFITDDLGSNLKNAYVWHINADEAGVYGFKNPTYSDLSEFRSSDHDPVIVDLMLEDSRGDYE